MDPGRGTDTLPPRQSSEGNGSSVQRYSGRGKPSRLNRTKMLIVRRSRFVSLFPGILWHDQTVKGTNGMPLGMPHIIHSRPHEGWHRDMPTSRSSAALTAVGCIHLFSTVLGGVASVQIDCLHRQQDAAEFVSRTFSKRSSQS